MFNSTSKLSCSLNCIITMDSYIPILAKFNHIFQEKPPNCGTHIQTMNNRIKRKTSLKTLRQLKMKPHTKMFAQLS